MIAVTRLGGQELRINADLIEFIETTPDTIVTLTTGRKLLVRETADEVTQRVLAYRRQAGAALPRRAPGDPPAAEAMEGHGNA